jgi:RsiW-degrading membrane proteinase PrsW (M82 family)
LADDPAPARARVPAATVAAPPPLAALAPAGSAYSDAPPAGLAGATALPLQVPRRSLRGYLYLLLLPALLPLAWSVLAPESETVAQRLQRTVQAHPEVQPQVEQLMADEAASLTDVFNAFPGHRLDGAHLAKDSWAHWLYALLAAGAFFALTLAAFPRGPADDTKPQHLLYVGLFTGTAGILFLLGVQFAADASQGVWIRGRGIVVLIFYIVKFIGFSYRAALGDTNFLLSFLGFTCGVGLCEELVKAAPLLWHYRRKATLDWRGACRWGFISGVGFGISEGISYSSDYYNGVAGPGIYVVRFVSCVTLHAVWSASAGISICRRQQQVQDSENVLEVIARAVPIVIVPMVLHGLYDTLLKKDMDAWALATAAVSFGWLAWQIEMMRAKERAAQAYGFPAAA